MGQTEGAWQEVGRRFSDLGERLKAHYREEPESHEEEEIRESLERVRRAADRLMTSAGNAMRDPGVQEQAKQAVTSLVDALEATFTELGDRLRRERDPGKGPDENIS